MSPPRAALIMSAALASATICALVLAGAADLKAAAIAVFIVVPFAAAGALIYAKLRRRGPVSAWVALAAGFALAAAPSLLLSLSTVADQASIGGVATIVDGHLTGAGWLQGLLFSGGTGAAGMGAAAIFCVLVRKDARGRGVIGWRDTRPALATAVLALGVVAGSLYAAQDRSCHNPMRNGGRSVAPVAEIKLRIEPADWRALGDELLAFGRAGGWNLDNHREWQPGSQVVYVDLCRESGTSISLNVMRFPPNGPGIFDHEVSVFLYQPQGGESWRAPFTTLSERLVYRWPGRAEGKPTGNDPRPK